MHKAHLIFSIGIAFLKHVGAIIPLAVRSQQLAQPDSKCLLQNPDMHKRSSIISNTHDLTQTPISTYESSPHHVRTDNKMEDQTTTPTPDLRNRIITLTLRIVVLTLDIATLTTLAVSLNLYSKWIPSTSYPTTALHPITNTDKTDWIVLAAIVISLVWTIFVTIRLALTRKPLHPSLSAASELICLVWLVACIIPAFVLRESSLGNLAAISNTCDEQGKVAMILIGGARVNWVCMPHLDTLKKVQMAAYSLACVVA